MTALTGLTASFTAEVLKLRKRPATWALGALLAAAIVLLRYVLAYVISRQAPGPGVSAQEIAMLKEALLPRNVVPMMLNILPGIGGAVALILGALVAGSEYGWTTLKTILTQRPGRLGVLGGKALAVGGVLGLYVALSFAASLAAGLVLAGVTGGAATLPGAAEIARGLGAAWLILAAWAALGMLLATAFRGTALAIGLGLIYSLVVESIIATLAGGVTWLATLRKGLPGANAGALVDAFPVAVPDTASALVGPAHAGLVLAAYVVAGVALAALLLRRRDVA